MGAAIGVGDQLQRIVSCHNKGAVVGGWTTAVNTTALGGLVGLATGTEITGSTSSGDVRSVDATYYIGAAGGAVGFARRDVTLAGDCLIQSRIEAWTFGQIPSDRASVRQCRDRCNRIRYAGGGRDL